MYIHMYMYVYIYMYMYIQINYIYINVYVCSVYIYKCAKFCKLCNRNNYSEWFILDANMDGSYLKSET